MVLTLGQSGVAVVIGIVVAVVVTMVFWSISKPQVIHTGAVAPVMRKGVRWWLATTILCCVLACVWLMLRGPLKLPRDGVYRFVPLAIALIPLLVVNPLYLWRTLWLRRALHRSSGRLCTHCGYDVSTLAAQGTCPECGLGYDTEKDRPLWGTFLKEDEGVKRESTE